jgi:hypothetical protein
LFPKFSNFLDLFVPVIWSKAPCMYFVILAWTWQQEVRYLYANLQNEMSQSSTVVRIPKLVQTSSPLPYADRNITPSVGLTVIMSLSYGHH